MDIGDDRLKGAGDDFYQQLMALHKGLSLDESAVVNARLVLILANLVGDGPKLQAALLAAAKSEGK